MSNELSEVKTGGLVTTIRDQGVGELLKPLIREIHLFDTFIAGTFYLKDQSVLAEIKIGDRLKLIREDNRFDSNAVMILTETGKKVGYVPEKDNLVFARLMDAGKLLSARITKIDKHGGFSQISIGIYLTDF